MSAESQERILKFASEEPEAAVGAGASEERADVDAFDVAAQRLVDELETFRRLLDEAQTDAFDAEVRLAKVEKELAAERDANARTAASRRLAVARRDEELIETRRQRDDFERIAREARRENWIWRVVGFIGGAACFGASWIF